MNFSCDPENLAGYVFALAVYSVFEFWIGKTPRLKSGSLIELISITAKELLVVVLIPVIIAIAIKWYAFTGRKIEMEKKDE